MRDLTLRKGLDGAVKVEFPKGEGAALSGKEEALADRSGLIVGRE